MGDSVFALLSFFARDNRRTVGVERGSFTALGRHFHSNLPVCFKLDKMPPVSPQVMTSRRGGKFWLGGGGSVENVRNFEEHVHSNFSERTCSFPFSLRGQTCPASRRRVRSLLLAECGDAEPSAFRRTIPEHFSDFGESPPLARPVSSSAAC